MIKNTHNELTEIAKKQGKKTLVLGFDKTLFHISNKKYYSNYDFALKIVEKGVCNYFYVKKRPFVDVF